VATTGLMGWQSSVFCAGGGCAIGGRSSVSEGRRGEQAGSEEGELNFDGVL
jgi:hypothetical protein